MKTRSSWLLLLALAGASCQSQHLLYVHQSVLGLDLSPPGSGASGTTSFSFGYSRETSAIVPRVTPPAGAGSNPSAPGAAASEPDAMSLVAFSRVHAVGLGQIQIGHMIATGTPALQIAKNDTKIQEAAAQVFRGIVAPAAAVAKSNGAPQ